MWNSIKEMFATKEKTPEIIIGPAANEKDQNQTADYIYKSKEQRKRIRIATKKPVGDTMPCKAAERQLDNNPAAPPWDWEYKSSTMPFSPSASFTLFQQEALRLGLPQDEADKAAAKALQNMVKQYIAKGAYDPLTGQLDIAKLYNSKKYTARVMLIESNESITSQPYCPESYDAQIIANSVAYMAGLKYSIGRRISSEKGPAWLLVANQFAAACEIFDMTGKWPSDVPYFEQSLLKAYMDKRRISPNRALGDRAAIIADIANSQFKIHCCDCRKDMAAEANITASLGAGREEYRCPECAERLLNNNMQANER